MAQYSLQLPDGSITWRVDRQSGRLSGKIGGKDAALQSAMMALLVPRFEHIIYGDGYGSELLNYLSEDEAFWAATAGDLVWEALQQDDRMISVKDVAFTRDGDSGSLVFTLKTFDGAGTVTI